jgi:ATP-dependent Clp protease ATP-binding subunit ClpA
LQILFQLAQIFLGQMTQFPHIDVSRFMAPHLSQALPRKKPGVGDEFVKRIQGQIDAWTKVAQRVKVEVVV